VLFSLTVEIWIPSWNLIRLFITATLFRISTAGILQQKQPAENTQITSSSRKTAQCHIEDEWRRSIIFGQSSPNEWEMKRLLVRAELLLLAFCAVVTVVLYMFTV
jgi:hypothetical protein